MSTQPSGTVTFLFTDIEGSTKRWERHPTAMAKAVARHDQLMRDAIAQHRGHVFKTVGDAFCAVFPTAEDAVAATLTAQRAMADEPWGEIGPIKVRTALHTGEAEERDADYFGPPVNRVARLVSAGHGGQMLVSSATGERVSDRLPDGAQLRSLGKHRLKDLAQPERILQLLASGLPTEFPKLKTTPSPTLGLLGALLSIAVALVSFRIGNRSSSEEIGPALFTPLSLYNGAKGLIIELSTLNEYVLLAVGGLFLGIAVAVAFARWRAVRRQLKLRGDEPGKISRWLVNQRTVAFFALLALTVLCAYAYQQYLWRVALPIPDDALGIALTQETSAATIQEQLADSLYTQGQAEQVIIRQLPVHFDARDTEKARGMGDRIGAKAVIIYRADDETVSGTRQYIAYVVFTNPAIGLTIEGATEIAAGAGANAGQQPLRVQEGVPVPVLRTESLDELINAAAGIIAYDDNRPRKAIEHLEVALPPDADAPNAGIINFYLGNAYNIDNQPVLAALAFERAAAFYERRIGAGEVLGPQDHLILAKTHLERGRVASFTGEWDVALSWYEKAVALRADLLARAEGLERPTDVHATFARLYTLMADVYRFQERLEDQRSWEQRALNEIDELVTSARPDDTYALTQEGTARIFLGDCIGAGTAFNHAIELEPENPQALIDAGIVSLLQERPDLARAYWQRVIDTHPEDIVARQLIADTLILSGLSQSFFEPEYLLQAERYYQQIVSIDPTNLDAHQNLASSASFRGKANTLDTTALSAGDGLTASRSQVLWPMDQARRQAAHDAFTVAIDERRILASELQPGSATADVDVAESYLARHQLVYASVVEFALLGLAIPDQDAMGKQILADAAQVHEWSDKVFANPDASRLDLARAWAADLEALEREWGWHAFIVADETKAAALEDQHRQAVAAAIAFVEAEPIAHVDEIPPMRIIYFKAMFIAMALDDDEAAAASLREQIDSLTEREIAERDDAITHYTTFCTEVREQAAGDEELRQGDPQAAINHFDAALVANPHHVGSLLGYGSALFEQGDLEGAIEKATTATTVAPLMEEPWLDLAFYQIAAGDPTAAREALARFLDAAGTRPVQHRMANIGDGIDRLTTLLEVRPERGALVREQIPAIRAYLDTSISDSSGSYQYPALYSRLGKLALIVDDPAQAENLLRRAIELDTHQPSAHADLIISVLVQRKDATPEITAAFQEIDQPFWSRVLDYESRERRLSLLDKEATWYFKRFPDRSPMLEPFVTALEAENERETTAPVQVGSLVKPIGPMVRGVGDQRIK